MVGLKMVGIVKWRGLKLQGPLYHLLVCVPWCVYPGVCTLVCVPWCVYPGVCTLVYQRMRAFVFLFQTESAGTVLSTNWNEIGSQSTDVKAPDGMEYKQWQQ